ncbi:MAG: hypothetical protein GOMPHAMPRED_007812 [Gomphillus americanus]|uniref:Vacuolar ATPase assembly protein VMA22 n=1 Tax=Gomphillus americanus TaxID=1940652 RepID=A0A8H3EUK0_9LECA|nr:MAG: hypothetical protein GOMPHAMPRED_007812 [Gomphillus americanus]
MPAVLQDEEGPLLEEYLNHLHIYTTHRTALQTQLRTAFLSLSKANFHSSGGSSSGYSSSRFGPEGFDGRHRAAALRVGVVSHATTTAGGNGEGEEVEMERESVQSIRLPYRSRRRNGGRRDEDEDDDDGEGKEKEEEEEEEEEEVISNPLLQFGILVPQSLKQAQAEFEDAVERMIELVNTERQLEECEREVWARRRKDSPDEG